MVLGLAGLGGTWRGHLAWGLPAVVGEVLMLVAAVVWAVVTVLYGLKWIVAREAALTEAAHPVQCCFIGLAGVATMLIAGAALPYSRHLALGLYGAGAVFTLAFAVWRTGGCGSASATTATPRRCSICRPSRAASSPALVGGALGLADLGQFFFGMGLFGWLAIESVLLHRLLTGPSSRARCGRLSAFSSRRRWSGRSRSSPWRPEAPSSPPTP